MAQKKKIFGFGRVIPGLKIDKKEAPYPVLNERDTRAAAGIMFVFAATAFALAFLERSYLLINIVVVLFFIEFFVRVVINPELAPFYATGSFFVRKMRPEYTGAAQKRFAWGLGLVMAGTMIVLIYLFNVRGLANLTICSICLGLLWLESSLGICVGCKMYYGLMNKGLIERPEVAPACPGGACSIR